MSQLTSTIMDNLRFLPAAAICSWFKKGGMAEERYMQLTKMSTSKISWKGPPLAVSAISHLRMLALKSTMGELIGKDGYDAHSSKPTFCKRSTAPLPQRPRAPITRALTSLRLSNLPLTASTIAASFWKGSNAPSSLPSFKAA